MVASLLLIAGFVAVVVALANKLARICWPVLSGDRGFAEEVAEMH